MNGGLPMDRRIGRSDAAAGGNAELAAAVGAALSALMRRDGFRPSGPAFRLDHLAVRLPAGAGGDHTAEAIARAIYSALGGTE